MHKSERLRCHGRAWFHRQAFRARLLDEGRVVKNIDKISYAADHVVSDGVQEHRASVSGGRHLHALDFLPQCDVIVNFAAESHVDNAITNAHKFCMTNFLGVQNLLELTRAKQAPERPLFVQISTDEVYGDIAEGRHSESAMLVPSNPYSATKAAADMLVNSWGRTYNVPWNIVRPANNYGLHQYPEKLIPKSAWRMKRGTPAIMHGDGSYLRSWLHADDTAEAILTVIEKGERNAIYNVGSETERRNVDVLTAIATILRVPRDTAWIGVEDRSGQDIRYCLDDSRLRALGWRPHRNFDEELEKIIRNLDVSRFA
jgi:dTDP-glucose 4,6-dehydratase